MKPQTKYIEQKSGFSGNGPAWIGLVSFSKSGKTIYFNGRAFKSLNGTGISGNYYDLESGNEYWISGVKKDMSDRHKFGGGKIFVEKRILDDYLKIINRTELPKLDYELISVDTEKPVERIHEMENEIIEAPEFGVDLHFKEPNVLSNEELEFVITELYEEEKNALYNKGRRFVKQKRLDLEAELENREIKNVV